MPTPASAEDIKRWLEELKSDAPGTRAEAANRLGQLGIRNAPIVEALERAASNDDVPAVRLAAELALLAIRAPSGATPSGTRAAQRRTMQLSRAEKYRDFGFGFVGWFLINGVIWLIITHGTSFSSAIVFDLCLFPINVLVPIFLGVNRRTGWIALGVLSALALNLLVALIVGSSVNGWCFVPVWVK